MAKESDVDKFIESQRTFTAQGPEYKKTKEALKEVLLALPDEDFKIATNNLILAVLHEKPYGQLFHLDPIKGKFKIMQLTIHKNMPISLLKWVIAHELGHAMQGRNWKEEDSDNLEVDADEWAEKWGFLPLPKEAEEWYNKRAKRF